MLPAGKGLNYISCSTTMTAVEHTHPGERTFDVFLLSHRFLSTTGCATIDVPHNQFSGSRSSTFVLMWPPPWVVVTVTAGAPTPHSINYNAVKVLDDTLSVWVLHTHKSLHILSEPWLRFDIIAEPCAIPCPAVKHPDVALVMRIHRDFAEQTLCICSHLLDNGRYDLDVLIELGRVYEEVHDHQDAIRTA